MNQVHRQFNYYLNSWQQFIHAEQNQKMYLAPQKDQKLKSKFMVSFES